MMPSSSFDRLLGDADGLLGSAFLDSAAPTTSAASLHHLVVTLGLIEISKTKKARVTGGRKRCANLVRHFIIVERALPTSQLI
jgi:hypothetical protein